MCSILDIMSDINPDRNKTELTDGNIVLRPYRKSDVNNLYQAVRESVKEMSVWLPFAHKDFSFNDSGRETRQANLGYWVRTSQTGQGVAASATLLLAKWGFETLKLTRIEILVATGNARSLRVAEKVGAKREGILRNRLIRRDKVHDGVMHSLIPGDIKV